MHFQPSAFIYLHLYSTETSPCCQQGAEARFLESGIESLTQTHGIQMTSTAPACQNTATFVELWQKLLHWGPLAAWWGPSRAQFLKGWLSSAVAVVSHQKTFPKGSLWGSNSPQLMQERRRCDGSSEGSAALPCSSLFIWAFSAVPLLQSIVPPAVLGVWLENRSLFWSELKKKPK